jgi:plasmid segregation protein ParM
VSYYSIEEGDKDDILIIDVGSRTINYSSFIEGKLEKNFTEKLGVFDLYSTIKDIQNSAGGDYVEEDIERLIKNNKIVVDSKIYLGFLKDILNRTKSKVNIKSYTKVLFVGGGSVILKDYIEANTPASVVDDAIFTNVIGAHKLCEKVWAGGK